MRILIKLSSSTITLLLCFVFFMMNTNVLFAKSDDPIELKLATYVGSTYHVSEDVTKWWCDEIEKRTNGRVTTKVFYGGSLYSANEQVEAIATGIADVDPLFVTSYSPGIFPMMRLVASPFLYSDSPVAARVGEELFNKYNKKQFDRAGVMLGWLGPTGLYLYIGNKPVHSLKDLKGMNIRTSGGLKATVMEKQYGVTATRIPSSEIYMAIQRGMCDGALKGYAGIIGNKLYEVAKYSTSFNGHGFAAVMCGGIMNPDTYKSLPEDIQKIVYQLNREASYRYVKSVSGGKEENKKFLKEQGVEFYDITGAELQKFKDAAEPIVEAEIKKLEEKGYPARQFYNDFKKLSKKYEDMTLEEYGRMQKENPVSMEKLGY